MKNLILCLLAITILSCERDNHKEDRNAYINNQTKSNYFADINLKDSMSLSFDQSLKSTDQNEMKLSQEQVSPKQKREDKSNTESSRRKNINPSARPPSTRNSSYSSIYDLYNKYDKWQYFTISPSKDTTITRAKGTQITIPRGVFNLKGTNRRVIKPIHLKVKEYQGFEDFLFSNMTTQYKDSYVETGGSIYIEAESKGEQLEMAEDRVIELAFPTKNPVKGMQTFNGFVNGYNQVVWDTKIVVESKLEDYTGFMCTLDILDAVAIQDQYRGGIRGIMTQLESLLKDSTIRLDEVSNKRMTCSFVIPVHGETIELQLRESINPYVDSILLDFVSNLNWEAQSNFSLSRVGQKFSFRFHEGDKRLHGNTILYTETFHDEIKTDTINVKRDRMGVMRYVLQSAKIGYINCDRFPVTTPRSLVKTPVVQNENAEVSLFFEDVNAVLRGTLGPDGMAIYNAPRGQKGSIIKISEIDGRLFHSVTEIIVGEPFKLNESVPFDEASLKLHAEEKIGLKL